MTISNSNEKVPVVVLCMTATGLTVARSLGLHGVPVLGVDGDRFQIGHYSGYIGKSFTLSCQSQPEILLEALVSHAKMTPLRPLLLVAGDDELQFVSKYADRIREHYIIPDSYNEKFSGLMLDKISFYQTCEKLGADIPVTFYPKDLNDVRVSSKGIEYPAIIKPGFGHAWRKRFKGKKVLEILSADDLIGSFEEYQLPPEEMVIQEVVPGTEDNIAVFGGYFNRNAEPVSVFTARKTRQYPPMFGSASLCESHWYPEIADLSIDLVHRMGYHGICGTEYKWDPRDNKWKLMEINFRPTLWFAITRAAGVDIIYDAYLDMIGQPVQQKIGTQKDGVLWQYLARDIVSVFHHLRKGEMDWKTFRQFLRLRKEYAVLSWKDWRTDLFYPLYVLHEYIRHM